MCMVLLEQSGWDFWEFLRQHYGEALLQFLERLLVALIILFVGWKLTNWLMKTVHKLMEKRKIDVTLERFASSIVNAVLKLIVVLQALGALGIESASIFALLGGSTLVVGLGLQGSLSNFAGGMLILLQKTFQVGDYISDGTHEGTVESINIISTRMRTPDNKLITLQNGALSNAAITNYSSYEERRLDFNFSISYDADIALARSLITEVMENEDLVLKDREKTVLVKNHGDSAIELFAFCWVKRADYFTAGSNIREQVKYAFDRKAVSIPYPQMDVHLVQDAKEEMK